MGSEIDKRKPRRRPSDLYGGLATATESGLLISPTSEWDLKQRRVWPPAPYQAYCEKHFLQECLVYYSLEMEKIEEHDQKIEEHDQKKKEKDKDRNQASEAEPLPSITATSRAAPQQQQQPTRVQPGRRAKASSATARSETRAATSSSSSSSRRRAYQEFSDSESEKMERRQELCLELSWAEFQAKLEALIKRTSKKLGRKQAKKSSPHNSGTTVAGGKKKKTEACAEVGALDDGVQCPLRGLIKVECRYCDHRPEITDGGGSDDDSDDARRSPPPPPPNRGAPVAPMHMLGEADFGRDQACTFGGLTFAVDVCGGAESVIIVLIEMRSLDLGRKDSEKDGGGDAGSVPKLPAQRSNKRAKTGKEQEKSEDLNWIPEDETD
ncbi:hypothetical protein PG991_007905 [Apiospora marii]|uniref:Uncharacterized protein n=1 Tax=Apiospora marii TaxID=335849 RepID=A0ABR1RUS1_9PEZI